MQQAQQDYADTADGDVDFPSDDDLAELEEGGGGGSGLSDDFSLDSLLNESMAQKRQADTARANRKMLAAPGVKIPSDERSALENTIRKWELQREWHPKANVAMFLRQTCANCGYVTLSFQGFFQRQLSTQGSINRWVRVDIPSPTLPDKESKYEDGITPVCGQCCHQHGYHL